MPGIAGYGIDPADCCSRCGGDSNNYPCTCGEEKRKDPSAEFPPLMDKTTMDFVNGLGGPGAGEKPALQELMAVPGKFNNPPAEQDQAVLAGTIAAMKKAGLNVVFEDPKPSAISELIRKMVFLRNGLVEFDSRPETKSVAIRVRVARGPDCLGVDFLIAEREGAPGGGCWFENVLDHAAGQLTRKIEKEIGVIE